MVTYFDNFAVEYIPKETIRLNFCRVQANDSTMCGYFCIGFIGFMLKGKSLLDYTNHFKINSFRR